MTAVVAVSCAGGKGSNNGNGGGTPTSGSKSDIASANDTGPVSVITEDPSCAPWGPINDTLANSTKNAGWERRDPSISASAWTPDMRTVFETSAEAFGKSADQATSLIKITTHRVMRELYQQYVAYMHAFVSKVPNYAPEDFNLVTTGVTLGMTITGICQAITFGSAAARGPLVTPVAPPEKIAPLDDVEKPVQFLTSPDPGCADWNTAVKQLDANPIYTAWKNEDLNIPASDWSPQYKSENDAVEPLLATASDTFERLGRGSANPVIQDFGVLAAQYGRAFIQGMPTYTSADTYLYNVFRRASAGISAACTAAGVA
ncbi:hypothetical protein [Mycolicibacterium aubagnense]|uniref:hypothetical protein n=1 Tax=Mycolicibacterium aubagnense TaxID=319707 RepID=UPI0010FD64F9|nr:hypothetical protein [Mycolicibacterium aubagnense]WGI32453.1 hypothetical protein QDT91_25325 [Mycolicibacterium aubagnense]